MTPDHLARMLVALHATWHLWAALAAAVWTSVLAAHAIDHANAHADQREGRNYIDRAELARRRGRR